MTDPITPVLTRNWADERAWKLTNYERQGGYATLRQALRRDPDELAGMIK
ncbi:MAG TPA: NADH-quinone oxidoreductase subunit F, partial [Microlunatus sp.]